MAGSETPEEPDVAGPPREEPAREHLSAPGGSEAGDVGELISTGDPRLDVGSLPDVRDLKEMELAPDTPPVLLEEFRAAMRDAGIESVVDSAVEAYLDETPKRMEALQAAVEAGDLKAVEREAHGIKSGSRNIRADDLAEQLEAMEIAGKEERKEDVLSAMPRLRDSFKQVLDYLSKQGPGS